MIYLFLSASNGFLEKVGPMFETPTRSFISLAPGFSPVWAMNRMFKPF
jgi:hypothetical protein